MCSDKTVKMARYTGQRFTLWEHPHDSTSPSSVTQHIQFSIFLHSKTLIHASKQTTTISPSYITASPSLSFYLSLFPVTTS